MLFDPPHRNWLRRALQLMLVFGGLSVSVSQAGEASANGDSSASPGLASELGESLEHLGASPSYGEGINFSEGTATILGQRINPTQNRAFRSQFETYLTRDSAAVEEYEAYQAIISEILEILSPIRFVDSQVNEDAEIKRAFELLYEAGKFEADGQSSLRLAGMIFNMWRLRQEIRADIRRLESGPRDPDSIHYIDRGAVETKGAIATAQFETQIIYFMLQRRYDHAIMASHFYRIMFKGSAQQLPNVGSAMNAVQNSLNRLGLENAAGNNLSMMMDSTGLGDERVQSPHRQQQGRRDQVNTGTIYTVEAVEQICQTIKDQVSNHVSSIRRTFEAGEYNTALERLQEVFVHGEYVKSVMELDADKRRVLLQLFRKHRLLEEYLSSKDYTRLVAVLDDIDAMTDDFIPGRSIRSQAENAKRLSQMRLVAAKHAFSDSNAGRGERLIEESAELWPLNPGLNDFLTSVDESINTASRYASRFTEWVQQGHYNTIFENREMLALALRDEADQLAELQQIVRDYGTAQFLLEQARSLQNRAPLMAWDLLADVPETFTNQADYLRTRQDLLMTAMPYANLIEKARAAEQDGKWNVAITHYLKALEMNPISQTLQDSIDELTAQLERHYF